MKNTLSILLILTIVALAPAAAQQAQLSGPVSGFIFDSEAQAIRPIIGIPGASYIGDALIADLDLAAVAPNGKMALALRRGDLLLIRTLDAAAPAPQLVREGLGKPDQIVWNSDSSAAALYTSANAAVQICRNLDATPTMDEPLDLSRLPGPLTALALPASARFVLGGVGGDAGGIYLAPADGTPARFLTPLNRPVALALARGDRDVFAADGASGEILEIRRYEDAPEIVTFASAGPGLEDLVGLALAADEKTLFVASRSAKEVAAYSTASPGEALRMPLDFEPSFMQPVKAGSLFLLSTGSPGKRPFLVLDAGQAPAVYFVPAGAAREEK